jgi:hypothetical protein
VRIKREKSKRPSNMALMSSPGGVPVFFQPMGMFASFLLTPSFFLSHPSPFLLPPSLL